MSSHIASFIAAVWSLIRIGIIPGESSNSRSLPKRTHLLQENGNKETVNQKSNENGFRFTTDHLPRSQPLHLSPIIEKNTNSNKRKGIILQFSGDTWSWSCWTHSSFQQAVDQGRFSNIRISNYSSTNLYNNH